MTDPRNTGSERRDAEDGDAAETDAAQTDHPTGDTQAARNAEDEPAG